MKLGEGGVGKFSKREENTVGKVVIVHYEQFLHFLWCFRQTYKLQTRNSVFYPFGELSTIFIEYNHVVD